MTSTEYRTALDALPYGKRLPGAVYLIDPGDAPDLPQLLRITVAELRKRLDIGPGFNLLKFHTASPKISFLAYPDFEKDPHPALRESIIVDPANLPSNTIATSTRIRSPNSSPASRSTSAASSFPSSTTRTEPNTNFCFSKNASFPRIARNARKWTASAQSYANSDSAKKPSATDRRSKSGTSGIRNGRETIAIPIWTKSGRELAFCNDQ